MKTKSLGISAAAIFYMIAALAGWSVDSFLPLVSKEKEVRTKRGVLSKFCCFMGAEEPPETFSNLNVAKYLKTYPKEKTYHNVMRELKSIIIYSNDIIINLEDIEAFEEYTPEETNIRINYAMDLWRRGISAIKTIKKEEWENLFELCGAENVNVLRVQRAASCERLGYLRFLIWFHTCDDPYDGFGLQQVE